MAVLGAAAAAGYSIYNDPQMPAFTSSYQARVGIWNNTSYHAADHTNFWQALARRGSTVNCSNLAAGTWKQIMSVTGSGFLGTVVFPRLTNDNWARWTIELTIDGVVTERTTPELVGWNTRRLVFGNMITGGEANNLPYVQEHAGRAMTGAGYFDYAQSAGGQVVSTGSASYMAVVPADIQMKRGEPVLKFNTNLTVRIKSTTVGCAYGGQNQQFAGALYIINP
jgi:hypothetical protein